MDLQTHLFLGAWHDSPAFGTTANPGIGVLARQGEYLGGLGVFRNSLGEAAPYGFVGAQPFNVGPVRVGGLVGATAYRKQPRPVGGLLLTYPHRGTEWHLLLSPHVKNFAPTTVALSVSF
jgi:hypothetical protein